MSEKNNIVTIDGPAGVGKSTISRKVAAALGFAYLDTGAMYRAVGWYLQNHGVDLARSENITNILKNIDLVVAPAVTENSDVRVFINGKDVSDIIRTPEMAMVASRVSALPVVRQLLTEIQRECGKKGAIVAEGRDTGTIVFPDAAYKFFLDAKPEERARRRVEQLQRNGVVVSLEQILTSTLERDRNDSSRSVAPLKQAADALFIDTTEKSLESVVSIILREITRKRDKSGRF